MYTMHRHPQFKPFQFLSLFMQNKQRIHRALTEVLTVSYRFTASVNIRGEAKTFLRIIRHMAERLER